MLDIKVLGTGCADCLKMEQLVIKVLQALGIHNAHVEFVAEQRLIEYGLLADRVPGLLINGKLAWAGSVPTQAQLTEWLQQALVVAPDPSVTFRLLDGTAVAIRRIRPDDAPRLQAFFGRLSPEAVFLRFLRQRKELPQEEVERMASADNRTQVVLVATHKQSGAEEIVAVASYVVEPAQHDLAEVAIVTEDRFRSWGLGTHLLDQLAAHARTHGIRAFLAFVHYSDDQAIWLIRNTGLPTEARLNSGVWEIKVSLVAEPIAETPREPVL